MIESAIVIATVMMLAAVRVPGQSPVVVWVVIVVLVFDVVAVRPRLRLCREEAAGAPACPVAEVACVRASVVHTCLG